MKQKGFAPILVLVGILVLAMIVGGVYYFGKSQVSKSQTQNQVTADSIGLPEDAGQLQKEIDKKSEGKTQLSFSLPDGFPKDFPVYPEARLLSAIHSPQDELSFLIAWVTDDQLDKVQIFYETKLQDKPWNVVSSFKPGAVKSLSRRTLTFNRQDSPDSVGMINLAEETTGRGKTSIRVSYTKR